MNPLIQLKGRTPVFLVALLFDCFAIPASASAQARPAATRPPNSPQARAEATRPPSGRGPTTAPSEIQRSPSEAGSPGERAIAPQLREAAPNRGNTAAGQDALLSLTSGQSNTAVGFASLRNNTTGSSNTAVGYRALENSSAPGSSCNTAVGAEALFNSVGVNNAACGYQALYNNDAGLGNTAVGNKTLYNNKGGSANVAIGEEAGVEITGNFNVCIGASVRGKAGESKTTRIANIYGSAASARAVYVDLDNKIGTLASTRRVKESIKPMDKASEAIFALRPVSFRYKKEIDVTGTPQFGLIAEEVAEINPDLVTRDAKGEVETVRYEAVNAMLLNEFLKEHRKAEQQDRRLEQQEATIAKQQKQIEALTAGLQKVSAQIDTSRPAPQTVVNNQ